MSARIDYVQQSPELFKKFSEFSQAVGKAGIEAGLSHLVDIRASQLNGCAFCLDMHVKQATLHGERPLRLHHVATWRESPLFSGRERAALAWTEALTRVGEHGATDAVYDQARSQFSDDELVALTYRIAVINAWNRLGVGFALPPGSRDQAWGLDKAGLV